MNGTMKRKSRYSTIKAAIHKPTPNEAPNASSTKSGRNNKATGGTKRYQIIRTKRKTPEIRKSTELAITLLTTITSRGKYTLEIRFEFTTRLFPLSDIAVEKNCHGSMPQKTSRGYGTPPEGILPNFPKTTVSTIMVKSGRTSDQATPTKVCL